MPHRITGPFDSITRAASRLGLRRETQLKTRGFANGRVRLPGMRRVGRGPWGRWPTVQGASIGEPVRSKWWAGIRLMADLSHPTPSRWVALAACPPVFLGARFELLPRSHVESTGGQAASATHYQCHPPMGSGRSQQRVAPQAMTSPAAISNQVRNSAPGSSTCHPASMPRGSRLTASVTHVYGSRQIASRLGGV
jgi:hypothetical protein